MTMKKSFKAILFPYFLFLQAAAFLAIPAFQYFLIHLEAAIAFADFFECHCLLSFQANLLNAHAIILY